MSYSDKELQTIEDMGGLFFTPADIACVLEIDPETFTAEIRLESGDAYKRYKIGWITAKIAILKSTKESAIQGSSPAQTILLEIEKMNNYA